MDRKYIVEWWVQPTEDGDLVPADKWPRKLFPFDKDGFKEAYDYESWSNREVCDHFENCWAIKGGLFAADFDASGNELHRWEIDDWAGALRVFPVHGIAGWFEKCTEHLILSSDVLACVQPHYDSLWNRDSEAEERISETPGREKQADENVPAHLLGCPHCGCLDVRAYTGACTRCGTYVG